MTIHDVLDFAATFAAPIILAAYIHLRIRHRRCKIALERVRGQRDELRDQHWRTTFAGPADQG